MELYSSLSLRYAKPNSFLKTILGIRRKQHHQLRLLSHHTAGNTLVMKRRSRTRIRNHGKLFNLALPCQWVLSLSSILMELARILAVGLGSYSKTQRTVSYIKSRDI
jgi:hypothetical protein